MNPRNLGIGIVCVVSGVTIANPPAHEQPSTMPGIKPVRVLTHNVAGFHAPCASHVTRDGFTSIQVNVDAHGCNIPGDAANEPSIAIDPTDPRKIAIGWRQFDSVTSDFRQAGYGLSRDGGHTWIFGGTLASGKFGSDPVLASTARGQFYYLSLGESELRLFRSLDAGLTWSAPRQVASLFLDKPWMAVDQTKGPGAGNVYVAANGFFFRSTDGGGHFTMGNWGFGGAEQATMSVAPDGVLFLYNGTLSVSESARFADEPPELEFVSIGPVSPTNCNSSFAPGNPNPSGLIGQSWVAAREGVLYTLDAGYITSIPFARSHDGGVTWDLSICVNDDPDKGAWHWFPMMSVAPNGRIDVCWNDTRNYLDAPEANLSELFCSYSIDGGDTWSPNVPVSPVFDSYVGWPQQNKIGDYYHMLSDNLGVNVAYAATFNGEQDIYFLRIGPWDCNGNQIDDAEDIANDTSLDCNGNGVPDECEYRADFDGDGLTTYNDFATFLYDFTGVASPLDKGGLRGVTPGARASGSDKSCAQLSDIDHDGDVDLRDFYMLQQVFVTS